ncbi:MAG TPA: calcium-binding protein [Oculatellaceae cyanobacterium]|jgi:Ca2+-binding RTX toxin-like protein
MPFLRQGDMRYILSDYTDKAVLETAVQTTQDLLKTFATAQDFDNIMSVAFGNNYDTKIAKSLSQAWQQNNFADLPPIEIRNSTEINGAMGAFAKATNTIYISKELIEQNANNIVAIADVLLEEAGHYIDAQINEIEAEGDEGAIFSALVQGKILTEKELELLKEEDDTATIILDGQIIEIEQANLNGTDGDDTLNGTTSADVFQPLRGIDTVNGSGGSDLLVIDYSANTFAGNRNYPAGIRFNSFYADGSGGYAGYLTAYKNSYGNYDQVSFSSIERFQITGTNYADSLRGGAFNDTLIGGAGNDYIDGGGGVDSIDGGAGIDTLEGADFSSIATGLIIDHSGNAIAGTTVTGIERIKNLTTGSGNDNINFTVDFNETINSGGGNDTINSGLGNDYVDAGAGSDVLVVNYSGNTFAGTPSIPAGMNSSVGDSGGGVYSGSFSAYKNSSGQVNQLNFGNVERFNITGTNFADVIRGGINNDTLIGGAGDDYISSGGGADSIDGGTGIDTLDNADFSSISTGLIIDNSGNAIAGTTVTGIERFNNLTTGSGNDSINFTVDFGETINTGGGNDTINSGLGNDYVDAGAGSDVLVVNYSSNTFAGNVSYPAGINSSVSPDGNGGYSGNFYAYKNSSGAVDHVNFSNIENFQITGTNFADTLNGGEFDDTINGGDGNDYINARNGNNVINSGAGNDTIEGSFATLVQDVEQDTGVDLGLFSTALGANNDDFWGAYNPNHVYSKEYVGNGQKVDFYVNDTDNATNQGSYTVKVYRQVGGVYEATPFETLTINSATNVFPTGQPKVFSSVLTSGTQYRFDVSGGFKPDNYNYDRVVDARFSTRFNGADTIDGGAGVDTLVNADFSTATAALAFDDTGTTHTPITLADGTSVTGVEYFQNVKTGSGNDSISYAQRQNNNISTGAGNDTINSGSGYDIVDGGAGTDLLVVDYSGNTFAGGISYPPGIYSVVNDNGAGGYNGYFNAYIEDAYTYDEVSFSNIENFQITGTSFGDLLSGGNLNDTLNGGDGDDIIDGRLGNDVINAGAGDDLITGGGGIDVIDGGTGSDTLTDSDFSAATSSLIFDDTGATHTPIILTNGMSVTGVEYFEGLKTGSGNDTITYSKIQNDTLNTGAGNDTINAGRGQDNVDGGDGNDLLIVDYSSNTFSGGGGYFAGVQSNVYSNGATGFNGYFYAYTSPGTADQVNFSNIENFNITGTNFADNFSGGDNNDTLTGGSGNDTLYGNGGNDYLDGGVGNDSLIGGIGNDTYVVNVTTDVITEYADEGTDTIISSVTDTLNIASRANVENLMLTGSAVNATGNALNNQLTGNSGNNTLSGGTGNDTLDGGAGIDTLDGGAGNDTYVIDTTTDTITETATGGNDTVQSSFTNTLANYTNIENLSLGGTGDFNATGNAGNNKLTGNSGANILDGGAGVDTLVGGDGNDTYIVDTTTDTITETATGGVDTVTSLFTYTLGETSNLENLTLTGSAVNATGNSLNNQLTGNSGNNTLTGNAGNDTLNGGDGVDILVGGDGNDTYIVDTTTDTITETATGGVDTVVSSFTNTVANYTNIENLTLGGTGDFNATGNAGNNVLTGNSGANILNGGDGIDTLVGGDGNDTYNVDTTTDTITETATGGVDTVQSSFTNSLANYTNVENLILAGTGDFNGTGNSGNNTLTGNSGANILDGGDGVDTLVGGDGNDTYVVDTTTETIIETATGGVDTVQILISNTLANFANVENLTITGAGDLNATGNALNNVLTGNDGANILDGGDGVDALIGGNGNDTYIVDTTTDTITETATGGVDVIQSLVSNFLANYANIEHLTLIGTGDVNATGNAGNNVLTGNSGANILDGGAGIDTLVGGDGNDTYKVDTTTDTITETTTGGVDTVESSITYTLGATSNLENLTLTGTTAINGTGNALNNTIKGNSAANTLSGLTGADTLMGEGGNDIYVVDNVNDQVIESASTGGIDTVQSTVNWTLSDNVEKLTLTGTAAINGNGNTLANTILGNTGANTLTGGSGNDTITGNAGNDILVGELGNDSLTGGTGADKFRFNASNEGIDKIVDFKASESDIIEILATGFGGGLVAGTTLSANQFLSGAGVTTAGTADQRFIYNTSNGALFYDVDGNGAGLSSQIATLSPVSSVIPALNNTQISII